MQRELVKDRILEIVYNKLNIKIQNLDENFFSINLNVPPINMLYIFAELEKEFNIDVNNRFIDHLPAVTMNYLIDAVIACGAKMN